MGTVSIIHTKNYYGKRTQSYGTSLSGHMYRTSLCFKNTSRGICWILESTLGQPGYLQTGCNGITVRFTWKDDCAEEMRIWPHIFPGFFEWPLLERSCLFFIKNGIQQLGKKSWLSSHAKIHTILDRKVHFYDEGKNLLDSKLFVKFQMYWILTRIIVLLSIPLLYTCGSWFNYLLLV